jgi:NAD(P)-dependent dehydrogenase (short-subunit alcohol dehydrogenase family)
MKLDGASAIVTGGSSGLGLATVEALAGAGARVVIADLAPPANAPAEFVRADVTNEADFEAVVAAATALGPLRVLVCCAGIATGARVVGKNGPMPLAEFERTIRVNLIGTFNAVRLAAAAMQSTEPVDEERGVIVTVASVAAFDGQVGQAAYSASKGGVAAMTLPIARELAASLIRVVTIAPGVFETPMMAGMTEQLQASLGAQVPHPSRLGRPAEFASLVGHIVDNPYLNGETIRLDGAIRMAPR